VADAVDEVVHGAAAVSFDLNLEQARAINVRVLAGTIRLVRERASGGRPHVVSSH